MTPRRRTSLIVLVLVVVGLACIAWYYLLRDVPQHYKSEEDHYKYGSIGVEAASGMPYWIWRALPLVFPEKMPGPDYRSFGFIFEDGHETPVGMPLRTVGFQRIGINCGLCHTGSVRASAEAPRQIVYGAPNTTLDLQRYLRFLFACAGDPRFTADNILTAIRSMHELDWIEQVLYRFVVIPQTRKAILKQAHDLAWMDGIPDWGPGRNSPFNPAKVQILKRHYDGTIDNADIEPLWNWRLRKDFGLHADGLNNSLDEIFLNSGIGNGAGANSIDRASLMRIKHWIFDLKPERYPFAVSRSNSDIVVRGKGIYQAQCAGCHAFGGDKTGTSIPVEMIGTDRYRLESWSQDDADAFDALDGYAWRYTGFRKTSGYVAEALDGIWIRAPYLHNGSVPSLADLLKPPAERPAYFYRGYDVYDPDNVGFVSSGDDAVREGRKFDTRLPGNGNQGHLFGTALGDDDKKALLEYMKTL
ncbi:cytochrome c [Bradyrhizobium elkanii]|uniref:c-type cytochrome n=1 Tax=Bradyrhizobium elkanii TaxID=29448 RepID=UPI002714B4F6|nr:cytochrome c [Bradyrhizobium elkanii]WLB09521.1 cytochrome c [Bradyrhizobium elkanii]WLB72531.1 cytochrome c [Bradyrhizobium elkanii]